MADEEQLGFEIPEDVEHGDTVVTEDGQEFVYLEVDDDGDPLPLEGVDVDALVSDADTVYDLSGDEAEDYTDEPVGKVSAGTMFSTGRKLALGGRKLDPMMSSLSPSARVGHLAGRAEGYARKNPFKVAAGAGAAGVAGGGAYMVAKKSLGTSVLEELSKAVTDEERNQIVAKMAADQEILAQENDELRKAFEAEQDARMTEAFIAKAAEYELPVDPEVFGPILKAMVEGLDEDQIEVLDAVLASRGIPLDEIGLAGGASSSGVLDEVYGLAGELVGKAAGGVTTEQATTALFEHNPDAYEAYLAENGR
jgi:hypothetical protein